MNFIKKIFAMSVLVTALTISANAASASVTYFEKNDTVVVSGVEQNVVAIEVVLDVVSGDASKIDITGQNSSANTFVVNTGSQVRIYSADSVDLRTGDDLEIILGTLKNVNGVTFGSTVYIETCDFRNNVTTYNSVSVKFDSTSDAPEVEDDNNGGSGGSTGGSTGGSSGSTGSTGGSAGNTDVETDKDDVDLGSVENFKDVSSHWAKNSIAYVVENGLFNGVTSTEFQPETKMSRAMFVTVLGRLDGADTSASQSSSFGDVPSTEWYTDSVNWAVENGIVNGITDSIFDPNGNVTREQMAVMLYKYIVNENIDIQQAETIVVFKDYTSISAYAKHAVVYMQKTGLINGRNDGSFDPQGLATRAEVATIMERFAEIN